MELSEGTFSNEKLHAQTLVWRNVFSYIDAMSLKCAVELGIPDAIHNHGRPSISLPDLLSAVSIPHSKISHLRRLMRLLTNSGFFHEEDEDVYSLTPLSRLLVSETETSLAPLIIGMLDPILLEPFQFMSTWYRSEEEGSTPFTLAHGCCVWGMTERDPKFNKVFSDFMASDARFLMDVLLKDCGHVFRGLRSLVDVAGGTGSAAIAIANAFPEIKCSVLDLPQVIGALRATELAKVEFVAGDMFVHIPKADAVFLKWILHGWSDEKCVKILQRSKEAIPSKEAGGKVIIVDIVAESSKSNSLQKSSETSGQQLSWDITMMVVAGGVQRTEQEWKKIFTEAGFTAYKITPALGIRSVIELYP